MTKWKYCIRTRGLFDQVVSEEDYLCAYGAEGWELIAVRNEDEGDYYRYTFKRPILPVPQEELTGQALYDSLGMGEFRARWLEFCKAKPI